MSVIFSVSSVFFSAICRRLDSFFHLFRHYFVLGLPPILSLGVAPILSLGLPPILSLGSLSLLFLSSFPFRPTSSFGLLFLLTVILSTRSTTRFTSSASAVRVSVPCGWSLLPKMPREAPRTSSLKTPLVRWAEHSAVSAVQHACSVFCRVPAVVEHSTALVISCLHDVSAAGHMGGGRLPDGPMPSYTSLQSAPTGCVCSCTHLASTGCVCSCTHWASIGCTHSTSTGCLCVCTDRHTHTHTHLLL